MRKLKDAFQTGQEGKALGPDSARRHRAANGLGRLIGAKGGAEKVGPNEAQFNQYLESLSDIAVGANRPAVELIQISSKLLGLHSDDPVELKISAKPQEFEWKVGFHSGESKDPGNKKLTPLVELPQLMIDGTMVPVDNVTISTSMVVTDDRFTAPETSLTINSRPAPTDNSDGVSADTIMINISSDGTILSNTGSNHPEQSNLEAFIEGIAESVGQTASAYAGVQQMGSQDFVI